MAQPCSSSGYGAHDLLPQVFVQIAGWGDLLAGLLTLGVTLLSENRARYLIFEIFGFADFVAAVGTGLTMFLLHDPRMAGIQTMPLALIPFYGVGISGTSHIMAFDLLRRHVGIKRQAKDFPIHAKQRLSRPFSGTTDSGPVGSLTGLECRDNVNNINNLESAFQAYDEGLISVTRSRLPRFFGLLRRSCENRARPRPTDFPVVESAVL